jgi:hypothetical protein
MSAGAVPASSVHQKRGRSGLGSNDARLQKQQRIEIILKVTVPTRTSFNIATVHIEFLMRCHP